MGTILGVAHTCIESYFCLWQAVWPEARVLTSLNPNCSTPLPQCDIMDRLVRQAVQETAIYQSTYQSGLCMVDAPSIFDPLTVRQTQWPDLAPLSEHSGPSLESPTGQLSKFLKAALFSLESSLCFNTLEFLTFPHMLFLSHFII